MPNTIPDVAKTIEQNKIVAIEKSVKSRKDKALTDASKIIQKPDLFNGQVRVYSPKDDDGDQLPSETQNIVMDANELIATTFISVERFFDVTATKDWGNCLAKADVVLPNGVVLVADAPATFLIFLEKHLDGVATFISKIPVLSPAETWTWDAATNQYRSDPVVTTRTKKVLRNHVKAEATNQHPAQVDTYTEDVVVGTWTTTKFSTALPASTIATYAYRVQEIKNAVKFARESANMTKVNDKTVAAVLEFIFA